MNNKTIHYNPWMAKLAYMCLVDYSEEVQECDITYVFSSSDTQALLNVIRILRRWGLDRESITEPLDGVPEIRINSGTFRHCAACGEPMTDGYCVNWGDEYYCSDECLHTEYTPEQWAQECEENDQSYYTEWESPYYN